MMDRLQRPSCHCESPPHTELTLQSYLLFGDEDYLGMFAASYTAAVRRMRLVGEFVRFAISLLCHTKANGL